MGRYFAVMSAAIERHGGTVEKFIGDAVMAVFGLPQAHEDDALRAVRAALDMRTGLDALNADLERDYGVTMANRTGVNTGEVVTDEAAGNQRLATGDAVNVAARLEQAAPAMETLLGALTHALVRDAVEAVPVEPLELKGKAERVPAYRLVGLASRERTAATPLVGRADELELLRQAAAAAQASAGGRLVTVVGEAGVGKSRLLREFTDALEGSAARRARALPPLRRRDHVLADRRGGAGGRGDHRGRRHRGRPREGAAAGGRERRGGRPGRVGDRPRPRGVRRRGDVPRRPPAVRDPGRRASARRRARRPALGRADAARARRRGRRARAPALPRRRHRPSRVRRPRGCRRRRPPACPAHARTTPGRCRGGDGAGSCSAGAGSIRRRSSGS